MSLTDFTLNLADAILNLAALLLWFNWRATRFDPLVRTSVSSLAGTLRRAEPQRWKGRQILVGLFGLLVLRGLFYIMLGPAVNWTPKLDLVAVVPNFRSGFFWPTMLYSFLSFIRALAIVYFWLLVLVMVNRNVPESDPFQRLVRLNLGSVARWPWPIQLCLPLVLVGCAWLAFHPLALQLGITIPVSSKMHLFEQALLVGGATYLTLKYLLPIFFILRILTSYVYLGNNPFWEFVTGTARNFLAPLRLVPLRVGRMDFAPVLGILMVFLLLVWPVPALFARYLAAHQIVLWPR
jgi:uncharacterized protein YggT (Ycf19 family)